MNSAFNKPGAAFCAIVALVAGMIAVGIAFRPHRPNDPLEQKGSEHAASNLSWDDATEFCRRFTSRETQDGRLPPGWVYELPTEAEWEYACRAGTTTSFSFGDDDRQLSA